MLGVSYQLCFAFSWSREEYAVFQWQPATLAGCVSFREYISRWQSQIWIWIWMRRRNPAFIYKTPCKVDKYERSVFSYEILPDTSISPPTNWHNLQSSLFWKLWYFNFGKVNKYLPTFCFITTIIDNYLSYSLDVTVLLIAHCTNAHTFHQSLVSSGSLVIISHFHKKHCQRHNWPRNWLRNLNNLLSAKMITNRF